MQLHHLLSIKRPRKRIGRGGKRGTYSGRGVKGQKARAGRRLRPAVRDLIIRLPKRRGFRNRPFSRKPFVLNISDLAKKLKPLANKELVVNKDLLKEVGILSLNYRGEAKVLSKGEINFPLIIKGLQISAGAKTKIEKAGGRIVE